MPAETVLAKVLVVKQPRQILGKRPQAAIAISLRDFGVGRPQQLKKGSLYVDCSSRA